MSHQRFRDNLNYYKMDPENFSKMYEEVVKNLTDKANKPGRTGKNSACYLVTPPIFFVKTAWILVRFAPSWSE